MANNTASINTVSINTVSINTVSINTVSIHCAESCRFFCYALCNMYECAVESPGGSMIVSRFFARSGGFQLRLKRRP